MTTDAVLSCFCFRYQVRACVSFKLIKVFYNFVAKEPNNFTIYDFIKTKPTNAFAEAVSRDTIFEAVKRSGYKIVIDFRISMFRVRTILQAIHGIGELTQLGVSDCQFDFI